MKIGLVVNRESWRLKKILVNMFAIIGLIFGVTGSVYGQTRVEVDRVKVAAAEKEKSLIENLRHHGMEKHDVHILIVAFKAEMTLELYAKKRNDAVYTLIAVYRTCMTSGTLGPKRQQGDKQIPEGFYRINRFNPKSQFHLSLGINYPNASDKILATAEDPGDNILIHGGCFTIGCLPVTDDKIKEIYLYALWARNNKQTDIPVYIFPFRMTESKFRIYSTIYAKKPELVRFWENLKIGHNKFFSEKKVLDVSVNEHGEYVF